MKHNLSIRDVLEVVANYYKITPEYICSSHQTKDIRQIRHMAVWLCRKLTSKTSPVIGNAIGGRDHSTILSSVKRAEKLLKTDKAFAEDLWRLVAILTSDTFIPADTADFSKPEIGSIWQQHAHGKRFIVTGFVNVKNEQTGLWGLFVTYDHYKDGNRHPSGYGYAANIPHWNANFGRINIVKAPEYQC